MAPWLIPNNRVKAVEDFNALRVGLASPEEIRRWSYGEVKKPETINYRTLKPERDGLFCAKIFGPINDYECLCGKYKRPKHRGVICEKCGVEVTTKEVRRERMGHIELASPVSHIWFVKSIPSRMALLLGMDLKELERIIYFDQHVVTETTIPEQIPLRKLMTDDELQEARELWGGEEVFSTNIGAEGVQELLETLDLEELQQQLQIEMEETNSESTRRKITKRLKLVNAFIKSGNNPAWMVLKTLPVLPPELRPLVPMEGGRFATSDLNDLYRRVISRNNRLARIMELRSPQIIQRNEKRMLQEAVDALLDNGRRGRAATGRNKLPLKSLSDMIKGKQGRFRQNLLGKRVDYSGRSVIVVGPTLKLHQCGLPKRMALELFRPFVYNELAKRQYAPTTKMAKNMVDAEHYKVWEVLPNVIREHPVLLNRAPTLHRLSIQAFEPVLIEGKAIQLHPLVCVAFNADFDGDQMAVHVPLTFEAQLESRAIMMSTNNILSPANGEPIINPNQDVVLGLYYLTREKVNGRGENRTFTDFEEVTRAYQNDEVELHSKIKVRLESIDAQGHRNYQMVGTTVGRALLADIIPEGMDFQLINKVLPKDQISKLIDYVYRNFGLKDTVIFADQLMNMGFRYSTKSGCSICIEDFIIPNAKESIIDTANQAASEIEYQFENSLTTETEKYNKVTDIWGKASDQIGKAMMDELETETTVTAEGDEVEQKSFNSVYMYADSKSRGTPTQLRQVGGMRGLMAKPNGEIMESPIVANFREGLKVNEYFMSTHGARKGLADTALKTSFAGYFTRRLVDVAQDLVITEADCGTSNGLNLQAIIERGRVVEGLAARVLGRVTADVVKDPFTEEVILEKGDLIDEDILDRLQTVHEIKVRSPVTCETKYGLCAKCYGRDLARGHLVNKGEAVGVMAAQSIGEPGTQLTLRTFHHGGAASRDTAVNDVTVNTEGTIKFEIRQLVERESENSWISADRSGRIIVRDNAGIERERHKIPYGAVLTVPDGSTVSAGQTIANWDTLSRPIISENVSGVTIPIDLISGETVTLLRDEQTNIDTLEVKKESERTTEGRELSPRIGIVDLNRLENSVAARNSGKVMFENIETFEYDGKVIVARPGGSLWVDSARSRARGGSTATDKQEVPFGSVLHVEAGDSVQSRTKMFTTHVASMHELPESAIIEPMASTPGGFIERGQKIASVPTESSGNMDIVGGLPQVINLFEARKPKESAILAAQSGTVSYGKDTALKNRLVITDEEGTSYEKLINKSRNITVFPGDRIEMGEIIVDGGALDPHDILAFRGVHKLTEFIVDGIQEVYRLQGVVINDKHIEVIVHQMLRKVEVTEQNDSEYVKGELVELDHWRDSCDELKEAKLIPAAAKRVLLPIRRASLETASFISAASFQETTRILTDAAVHGKRDELRGLKENVIVGRLIPAGTGLEFHREQKRKAEERRLMEEAEARGLTVDETSQIVSEHSGGDELSVSEGS